MVAPAIELGVGFHWELSGRENIELNLSFLGFSRREVARRMGEVIEFSDLHAFIDSPIKNYSTGMMMRLAFAVSICTSPDILLIDEVLSVGDQWFQARCMDRMQALRRGGCTILFASHSMDQVATMCDRALLVRAGRIVRDDRAEPVIAEYADAFRRGTAGSWQSVGTEGGQEQPVTLGA
jgi:ABC-type polysaccharide/polyol phosphate transport system ATPase subunit